MIRQFGTFLSVALIVTVVASGTTAHAWKISNRWTATKTDGGGNLRGDALTLQWSVVPDGESYSRAGTTDLIDYLDVGWNVSQANRTPDLTNRPWWSIMNRVYEQYSRVSGLTMVYTPEQNSDGTDAGQSGDIRIGGIPFTWENDKGGVLADNSFPNNGDMRIDTYRGSNGVPSFWHTNNAAFRNLIAHESGHGVGLEHDSSSGRNFVMETPLNTGFWGLQFDDIYAFNRMYGDPLEKNGGNDNSNMATLLGNVSVEESYRLGEDAANFDAAEMEDQWMGIDGNSDEDWFEFTAHHTSFINIEVTPLGPSYTTNAQGSIDTSAMSDLKFRVYDSDGSTLIATIDSSNAGEAETFEFLTPSTGSFFIEVDGETDQNQFYQLDVISDFDAGIQSDLNQDGQITLLDWHAFKSGQGIDMSALSPSSAAELGDLDGDLDNDYQDFNYFKLAFENENGAGSFSALLASVPEPSSLGLMLLGSLVLARMQRN